MIYRFQLYIDENSGKTDITLTTFAVEFLPQKLVILHRMKTCCMYMYRDMGIYSHILYSILGHQCMNTELKTRPQRCIFQPCEWKTKTIFNLNTFVY